VNFNADSHLKLNCVSPLVFTSGKSLFSRVLRIVPKHPMMFLGSFCGFLDPMQFEGRFSRRKRCFFANFFPVGVRGGEGFGAWGSRIITKFESPSLHEYTATAKFVHRENTRSPAGRG
jgi:hypothetical protein